MNKAKLMFAVFPAVLLLVSSSAVWARTAELYNPSPITAPCALGEGRMKSAIRTSLHGRGWTVHEKGAGVIEGKLNKRTHVAVVTITYAGRQVKIRYKSSENLNYAVEDGKPVIHGNYNKWIKNLERDIDINMSKACG